MNDIILETTRLALRLLSRDDIPALRAMLQDPRVMYAYEGPFSEEMVQQWYLRQQERYTKDGFGLWSVIEKESDNWIGLCGLTIQNLNGNDVVEVGYQLTYANWHKGYATEAAKGCMEYAMEHLGIDVVYSIIRDTNKASMRVAERNGMRPAGAVVKYYRGIEMPHIVYMKTNSIIQRKADT